MRAPRRLGYLVLLAACACARPFLARDGTLIFSEPGTRGASVVTANGVEFRDVTDVPQRVVVRDPYEPWRAPVGFLVPADGRFTKTSAPSIVATTGLGVSLRLSDERVPSWGGEMLVRVDVLAPAATGTARWGEDLAIVIDGHRPGARDLVLSALGQLGGRDRVVVVDASGPRIIVPTMPASHRSLAVAAIDRALSGPATAPTDRTAAVVAALHAMTRGTLRRVLVLSDATDGARDEARAEATRGLGDELVPLRLVSTSYEAAGAAGAASTARVDAAGGTNDARAAEVRAFVPPAGDVAFRNVVLAFEGTPAPSHVLEASGGDARWELEGGELALGDVRAGDERAEVLRVTIPAWTPGEPFTLHMTARFEDAARSGAERTMAEDVVCAYDDDIARLAESRHGDVIAYASALATLARLDAAFLGDGAARPDDLRPIARMHARSLAQLARDMHDPAAAEQAALLDALLAAAP